MRGLVTRTDSETEQRRDRERGYERCAAPPRAAAAARAWLKDPLSEDINSAVPSSSLPSFNLRTMDRQEEPRKCRLGLPPSSRQYS